LTHALPLIEAIRSKDWRAITDEAGHWTITIAVPERTSTRWQTPKKEDQTK